MPTPNWLLDGRSGHVVILKAQDPDCLNGEPWGSDRCVAATKSFNAALGLEGKQYVLTYENGMVQAHVGCVADDALEAELGRSYHLGISSGLNSAAGAVLERAAKLWKAGKDDAARMLREIAKSLEDQSKTMRPDPPESP